MKSIFNLTFILQAFIIFLCAWDAACTQFIIKMGMTGEGNPLMAPVIDMSGWSAVWAIKLGLGCIFAFALPALIKSWWGRGLVSVVYLAYSFVAVIHLGLLLFLHFPA